MSSRQTKINYIQPDRLPPGSQKKLWCTVMFRLKSIKCLCKRLRCGLSELKVHKNVSVTKMGDEDESPFLSLREREKTVHVCQSSVSVVTEGEILYRFNSQVSMKFDPLYNISFHSRLEDRLPVYRRKEKSGNDVRPEGPAKKK